MIDLIFQDIAIGLLIIGFFYIICKIWSDPDRFEEDK